MPVNISQQDQNILDVVVVGGGAAGFFAAINCARQHKHCRVTLLEKSSKLLSKVRVSGGGRCNVTHACFDPIQLVKHYPRGEKALKGAFSRFHAVHTVEWFRERGVQLKTEADGRMFPVTDHSETIVSCLITEAEKAGVVILTNTDVKTAVKEGERFILALGNGKTINCNRLLVATGGNAKAEAYRWLEALGHRIEMPVPSLFTFNMPGSGIVQLMGVSVDPAQVRIQGTRLKEQGPLLITHWGMSGPCILRLSAWGARLLHELNYRFSVQVNWLPQLDDMQLRNTLAAVKQAEAARFIASAPPFELPRRLWEYLVVKSGIKETLRWADLPKKEANRLMEILMNDTYEVQGKTTFKEEFVTCGGIRLDEIDFKTMQSRKCPGLYFAGEVLDVDGITGGFNFQHAWTTGWIAAQAMGIG